MNPKILQKLLYRTTIRDRQKGAVTVVESLIALTIGIAILIVWAQAQGHKVQVENAKHAGRMMAVYAQAASQYLLDNRPTVSRTLTITDLQNCANSKSARQYLACTYGSDTSIPYATNSEGETLTFSNLFIVVDVTPNISIGTIDFGVFRSGNNDDEDTLPKARPDLAAIALQAAKNKFNSETQQFFEFSYKRNEFPELDPDDPNDQINQSELDELASIQANFDLNSNELPFLRVDGSNQMEGAISFSNNMSIKPTDAGLIVEGKGDVEFNNTSVILTANLNAQDAEATNFTATDSLTVNSEFGAKGEGFTHLDQRDEVSNLDGEILRIDQDMTQINSVIEKNSSDIEINTNLIQTNSTAISTNTSNIQTNFNNVTLNAEWIGNLQVQLDNLEIPPSASPVPDCIPTKSDVVVSYAELGFDVNNIDDYDCRTNSSICYDQDRRPASGIAETYQVRDLSTLECSTRSITFYAYCEVSRNDECVK